MRVRDPEQHALWLLDNGRHPFSAYLESVRILHARGNQSLPVWEFSGQNYHKAFKLPPGADFVVRNLEFMKAREDLDVVFLERIVLNHDRVIDGTDREGVLPARGELDMSTLDDLLAGDEGERLYPRGKERVSIDTWCIQKVPIPRGN